MAVTALLQKSLKVLDIKGFETLSVSTLILLRSSIFSKPKFNDLQECYRAIMTLRARMIYGF